MKQETERVEEIKTRLYTINIYLKGIKIIVSFVLAIIVVFVIVAPGLMSKMTDCNVAIFDDSKCGTIAGVFVILYTPLYFLQLGISFGLLLDKTDPKT